MTFESVLWWSIGPWLGITGALLIVLERVGLHRAERAGRSLRRLADDLSFRIWNPADIVETIQDFYWKRRRGFFLVAGSAMFFVPAFASAAWAAFWPVRIYLKGLAVAWCVIGAIYLPLMAAGGMMWLFALRRATYPTAIDHLFGVAFWTFNRGLVLTVPAAVLLLGVPVVLNFLIVSLLIDLAGILFLVLACLPLRVSRWTHERYALPPLMVLGLLLLITGCTMRLVTSF